MRQTRNKVLIAKGWIKNAIYLTGLGSHGMLKQNAYVAKLDSTKRNGGIQKCDQMKDHGWVK